MVDSPSVEQVPLETMIEESLRLGHWAYVATANASGRPFVTPVHPNWEGGSLWAMVELGSAKAKNIAVNPQVSCHWMVGEDTEMDSLILWGKGEILSDIETKKRLWDGVFNYDLEMWAPGGPENCPDKGFLKITPEKIVLLRFYGAAGRLEWHAGADAQ